MTGTLKKTSNRSSQLAGWVLSLAVALAFLLPELVIKPAHAQNSQTLFQRLFKPNRDETAIKRDTRKKVETRQTTTARPPTAAPAAPAVPEIEKLENARVVLVVGDFLAGSMADGLVAAFAESPDIRVVEKSNGSSGIVRDDFYDWQTALPELLDTSKPSAVVVMIGANDRQDFRTTDPPLVRRTEEWAKEYEKRVASLARLVTERNIPLVWVGVPAFQSPRMTSDMLAFNDIYRRVVTDAGGTYVDIWDGFVNEAGAYVTSGPDINGQPARLRASDGINVTKAGRRKIAFYAEKPLTKALGNLESPVLGALGPENLPALKLDPSGAPVIDRTNPIAFGDPELDGGTELLGADVEADLSGGNTTVKTLTVDGLAGPAKPGRADEFKLKPAPAEAPAVNVEGPTL